MKTKFFTVDKLFDNVTRIGGLAGELCYLVEGREKALLIDGLTGVGSLKALVRELTDLPVEILNTHGHVDHCGADFEYRQAYIHPADIALLYRHGDEEMRRGFAASGGAEVRLEDVVPLCNVRTLPIADGDVFDLGGVRLEVIAVPGHTRGTVVLLDRDRRIVYSGDACNANTLVADPACPSIEEYRESLEHFRTFQPAFDGMYGGHGHGPVPNTLIDEAIQLCGEIMAGTDDRVEMTGIGGRRGCYAKRKDEFFRRLDGGIANIFYDPEHIFR